MPDAHEERQPYQEIVDRAIVATGTRFVLLARVDPTNERVHTLAFAAGPPGLYARAIQEARRVVPGYRPDGGTVPVGLNAASRTAYQEGRTMVEPLEEMARGFVPPVVLAIARRVLGVTHVLHVPLRVGAAVAGSLSLVCSGKPGRREIAVAEAFAQQAGLTLANAQLAAELRDRTAQVLGAQARTVAAQENARREIAEMLHGTVQGQLLLAARRLREAHAVVWEDPGQAAGLLAQVASDLDRLREEDVRQASHRLHPALLGTGLRPALALLAEHFAPAFRVRVRAAPEVVTLDDPLAGGLSPALRLAAYRVVEEALGNAARHAEARVAEVGLELGEQDGRAALVVKVGDDGRGFDPGVARTGMGLLAMGDRLAQFGGTLTVRSAPECGTVLTAWFPL